MTITRENDELIIRIPKDMDVAFLQKILNHYRSQEIVKKSKATQKDVNDLVNLVHKDWLKANPHRIKK